MVRKRAFLACLLPTSVTREWAREAVRDESQVWKGFEGRPGDWFSDNQSLALFEITPEELVQDKQSLSEPALL